MNCYRHPSAPAAAECVSCMEPICATCREDVAGHAMCRPCLMREESRLGMEGTPAGATTAAATGGTVSTGALEATRTESDLVDGYDFSALHSVSIPGKAPGLVRRSLRGIGWGIVYGQIWTALTLFWSMVWSGGGAGENFGLTLILLGVFYGFFGGLTGLVIGASNSMRGHWIGAAAGVGVGLLEAALGSDTTMLINLFFFFFTGQWIGGLIMERVHRPLK
jgi:hypothetical protein